MADGTGLGAALAAVSAELAAGVAASDGRLRDALAAVRARDDPACVPSLLGLLDDGHAHQRLMWAVMHAAESFPMPAYLAGLVEALPALDRAALGWAGLLAKRVLNGVRHRPALAERLNASPDGAVEAVRRVLARVAARDPELFAGKAYEVASALRDPA